MAGFLFVVWLVVACVPSVVSTDPRCCGERQFMVDIAVTALNVQGGRGVISKGLLSSATDVDGERVARQGYWNMGGQNLAVKIIDLWEEGISYFVVNGGCTVHGLARPKPWQCIPDNSTFRGYASHGKDEFATRSFKLADRIMGAEQSRAAHFSVSNRTCVPVSYYTTYYTTSRHDVVAYVTAEYLNYTSGIKDPKKWFTVPSACHQPHPESNETERPVSPDLGAAVENFRNICSHEQRDVTPAYLSSLRDR